MSAFRHLAGDVLWGAHPLEQFEVDYLRTVFRDQTIAAFHAHDDKAEADAQGLLNDLIKAIYARKDWMRCAGAIA